MGNGRRATLLTVSVASAALLLAGCGGGSNKAGGDGKPSASSSGSASKGGTSAGSTGGDGMPSPSATQILAQIKGEKNVEVTINSATRDHGGFVTVQGTLTNNGDSVFNAVTWRGPETGLIPSGPSVAGAVLVDEGGKKRYYVLRDTEGKCLCTMGLTLIQPTETRPFFAQFPAPPAATTEVEFELPTMPPAKITLSEG